MRCGPPIGTLPTSPASPTLADLRGLIQPTPSNAASGLRGKDFRINSLTSMTPETELCPVREWLRICELHGGRFIDPCGLGTLMPEEEPESPEEVRSQCTRFLECVDEGTQDAPRGERRE